MEIRLLSRTTVETVCLLSKLHEAKHHINVKVDMDELDLTSAEAKATYKEIVEWVQEHYGFHVTNLKIADSRDARNIIILVFTRAYSIVYNIFVVTIWINRCRIGGNHENARRQKWGDLYMRNMALLRWNLKWN
nr:hypothetical protein [Butyrivibrio hungatei]